MFIPSIPNIAKPFVGCSASYSTSVAYKQSFSSATLSKQNNVSDIDCVHTIYTTKKKELLMFFENMDNLLAKELLKDVSTLIDNVSKIDSNLLKSLVDKI